MTDPICQQTSSNSVEIVNDVLSKLLTVAITDPSAFHVILASFGGNNWLTCTQVLESAGRYSITLKTSLIAISLRLPISDVSLSLSMMKYLVIVKGPSRSLGDWHTITRLM